MGVRLWQETQALLPDLAGVLARFQNTGTDHGVCDVARVGLLTLLVVNDGDVGTSQGVGQLHCGNGTKGYGKRRAPGPLPPSPSAVPPLYLYCGQSLSFLLDTNSSLSL